MVMSLLYCNMNIDNIVENVSRKLYLKSFHSTKRPSCVKSYLHGLLVTSRVRNIESETAALLT